MGAMRAFSLSAKDYHLTGHVTTKKIPLSAGAGPINERPYNIMGPAGLC